MDRNEGRGGMRPSRARSTVTVLETQPNKERGLGALVLGLVLALLLVAGSVWGSLLCSWHWGKSDSVKRVDAATIAFDAPLGGHFVAMEGRLLIGRRVAVEGLGAEPVVPQLSNRKSP